MLRADGDSALLTELEARLLEHLADRAGQPVSRSALLEAVWGVRGETVTRCVDSTVRRLRLKIEAEPGTPRHLRTVHGEGYLLDLDSSLAPGRTSPGFYGRRAELGWVQRALSQGARRITVVGPPGSGRRRLVEEARQVLDVPAGVALDAADTPQGAPGERVLILGSLEPDAALALLAEQSPGPHDAWAPLVDAVEGLPLALLELAERARLLSPEALRARLEADPARLLPQTSARSAARWATLSAAERDTLCRLAACARDSLPLEAAEDLLGAGGLERLEALATGGLLLRQPAPDGTLRLRLPRMLRVLARREADDSARRGHRDWLRHRLDVLQARYHGEGSRQAVDEALALLPEVTAALPLAEPEEAAALASALDTPLLRRGKLAALAALQDALAGRTLGLSPGARSQLRQSRAERLRRQRRLDEAETAARAALDDAEESGSPRERGMALGQAALIAHTRGEYARAESGYREAIAALAGSGAARQAGSWVSSLATLLGRLGRHAEATALLRDLISRWHTSGDARLAARARGQLARMLIEQGLPGQARGLLAESLPVWSRLGEPDALALDQIRLGLLEADRGRWTMAREAFQQAIPHARAAMVPRTTAQATGFDGMTALLAGQPGAAEPLLRRCVEQHRSAGHPDQALAALGWLVALEAGQGRLIEARASASEAALLRQSDPHYLPVQRAHIALSEPAPVARARGQREARAVLAQASGAAALDVELRLACRHLAARLP